MDENVRDYTATLLKRERVSGQLTEYQSLEVKVRHRRTEEGKRSLRSACTCDLSPRSR